MTDFLKIAKSIVVHFAHICAYGVETVNQRIICAFIFRYLFLPRIINYSENFLIFGSGQNIYIHDLQILK